MCADHPILSPHDDELVGRDDKQVGDIFASGMGKCCDFDDDGSRSIDSMFLQEMMQAQAADINSYSRLLSLEWDWEQLPSPTAAAYDISRLYDATADALLSPAQTLLDHLSLPMPSLFPGTTGMIHDPPFVANAQFGPHTPNSSLSLMRELFQSPPALFGDGGGENVFAGEGPLPLPVPVQGGGGFELRREGNASKQQTCVDDRERRCHIKDKFNDLKMMIPNSTKSDKASVVGDTIEYIEELKSNVNELKMLVEKKKCGIGRRDSKRQKIDRQKIDQNNGDMYAGECAVSCCTGLKSCLFRRKSDATEVKVRIIDDEVAVKLVHQQPKIDCLLHVSRAFDDLQLNLHHVVGGQLGNCYSFFFNSKIREGYSVLANVVASKLIEASEGHSDTVRSNQQ